MLKRPSTADEPARQSLSHKRFLPGVVVVRWKQDVLPAPAARRGAKKAAKELPDQVGDRIKHLQRNFGLKRVVPLSGTEPAGPRRAGLRRKLSTETEAVARSLTTETGEALRGVTLLEFDLDAPVGQIARSLQEGAVEYAQPAPARWAAAARGPADPKYNAQWGLPAIDWFNAKRPKASDVKVAVLDSGVERRHPDLRGVVSKYDRMKFSTRDLLGHGTHVSGIVAAVVNNKIGIAGVAGCRLCCWKVFEDTPADDGEMYIDSETYYRALAAASKTRGVKVINLSLGGVEEDFTETDLIKGIIAKNEIVVVAAMGNEYKEGNPVEYPCSIKGVVAVGAISQSRKRASSSNTGKHISLVAPGVNILSTLPLKTSDVRDETEYAAWDGTSMATPFVSGVAALIWAQNPKFTAEQVRNRLLATTTRLPSMNRRKHTNVLGAGLLNARKALQK